MIVVTVSALLIHGLLPNNYPWTITVILSINGPSGYRNCVTKGGSNRQQKSSRISRLVKSTSNPLRCTIFLLVKAAP